jgi:hypothetical protein
MRFLKIPYVWNFKYGMTSIYSSVSILTRIIYSFPWWWNVFTDGVYLAESLSFKSQVTEIRSTLFVDICSCWNVYLVFTFFSLRILQMDRCTSHDKIRHPRLTTTVTKLFSKSILWWLVTIITFPVISNP